MPRGRVTKLTPHLQTAIVNAVATGVHPAQAALLAGIHPKTVQEWIARGEGTDPRPSKPLYAAFATAITRAKAEDEARRLARLAQAARGGAVLHEKITTYPDGRQLIEKQYSQPDWRADAFHLERAYPERWGRRVQADLDLRIRQAAAAVAAEVGIDVELLLAEARAFLKESP